MIGIRTAIAAAVLGGFMATDAISASKATAYLVAEQIKRMCPNGGRFDPVSVIERDVTGDGKADLILDFSGLKCRGASNGLNDECGAAHCSVRFYVRRNDLLAFDSELMSIGVKVGPGDRPKIGLVSFEYKAHSIRWNGSGFR